MGGRRWYQTSNPSRNGGFKRRVGVRILELDEIVASYQIGRLAIAGRPVPRARCKCTVGSSRTVPEPPALLVHPLCRLANTDPVLSDQLGACRIVVMTPYRSVNLYRELSASAASSARSRAAASGVDAGWFLRVVERAGGRLLLLGRGRILLLGHPAAAGAFFRLVRRRRRRGFRRLHLGWLILGAGTRQPPMCRAPRMPTWRATTRPGGSPGFERRSACWGWRNRLLSSRSRLLAERLCPSPMIHRLRIFAKIGSLRQCMREIGLHLADVLRARLLNHTTARFRVRPCLPPPFFSAAAARPAATSASRSRRRHALRTAWRGPRPE